MCRYSKVLFSLICCCLFIGKTSATIYYVDHARPDNAGAGTSWSTAKKDLQNAINIATAADEIWVKQGTYYPTMDNTQQDVISDKEYSFYITKGVKIYGGFAGGETSHNRNIWANPTILSGNLGSKADSTDNARHVITIALTPGESGTTIDGFTIQDGYAISNTIQVVSYNGHSIYSNYGGAIYCNLPSNVILLNNNIHHNVATIGGAIYMIGHVSNWGTTTTIAYNSIHHNRSTTKGGGIYSSSLKSIKIYSNHIDQNFATNTGGGIYVEGGVTYLSTTPNNSSTIEANTIVNNSVNPVEVPGTQNRGGGVFVAYTKGIVIDNTFEKNSAPNGGGLYFQQFGGSGTMCQNNVFYKNSITSTSGLGAALFINSNNIPIIHNTFVENQSGGAVGLYNSPGPFYNNVFYKNKLNNSETLRGADISTTGTYLISIQAYNNALQLPSNNYTFSINYTSGNIFNQNPQFLNELDIDGSDNYHRTADDGFTLAATSPCINIGKPTSEIVFAFSVDRLGVPRLFPDMGAYEAPFVCPSNSTSLHVDQSVSTSGGDGTTWVKAMKNLSIALATAHTCKDIQNIFVAQGTYTPSTKAFEMNASQKGVEISDARPGMNTFHVRAGLSLYGGYAPGGVSQNTATYPTILDGQNNLHTVIMDSSSHWTGQYAAPFMSGFTIKNGNANSVTDLHLNGRWIEGRSGGGIYVSDVVAYIYDCTFLNNKGDDKGSALRVKSKYAELFYNTFKDNSNSNCAGSMAITDSKIYILECNFINNSHAIGGAMFLANTTGELTRNTFINNSSQLGGALFIEGNSVLNLYTNVFYNNSGSSHAGGIYIKNNGIYKLENNTFAGNSSSFQNTGGAIYDVNNSARSLSNNIFYNNKVNNSTTAQGADVYWEFYEHLGTPNNVVLKNNMMQLPPESYTLHTELLNSNNNLFNQNPLFTNIDNVFGIDNKIRTTDDGLVPTLYSPAKNKGTTSVSAITSQFDITHSARSPIDIGAYESSLIAYQSTSCPAFVEIYVDSTRSVNGNGSSWATAFKSLADALNLAWTCPNITKIHIAKGTYVPTRRSYSMQPDRSGIEQTNGALTFHFRVGLQVLGGYPSGGGVRNVTLHKTKFGGSGDISPLIRLNTNGYWGIPNDTTLLDGITVSNFIGTVMYINSGLNILKSCTIINNSTWSEMIHVENAKTIFDNCIIDRNTLSNPDDNDNYHHYKLISIGNDEVNSGDVVIKNSSIRHNNLTHELMHVRNAKLTLDNVDLEYNIIYNTKIYDIDLINIWWSELIINNSRVNQNNNDNNYSIFDIYYSSLICNKNSFKYNELGYDGIFKIFYSSANVSGNIFDANKYVLQEYSYPGLRCWESDLTFADNYVLNHNTFSYDNWHAREAFLSSFHASTNIRIYVHNNVFYNNFSVFGAVSIAGSSKITNNAFIKNLGVRVGSLKTEYGVRDTVANNIFIGDSLTHYPPIENLNFRTQSSNALFSNNFFEVDSSNFGYKGLHPNSKGNIFRGVANLKNVKDLDGADNVYFTPDDGLIPLSRSVLINRGNNAFVNNISKDMGGNARKNHTRVDIGPYEFIPAYCTNNENVWLGTQNEEWYNEQNWTCNIPLENNEVIIRADVPYHCKLQFYNYTGIKKLTLMKGSNFQVQSGKRIDIRP
jgi:hypothetical protein